FVAAGGTIRSGRLNQLTELPREYSLVINCSGIGARELAADPALEPHRGQIVLVPKFDLSCAVVSDHPPLMYAIPRQDDCVFGGTNQLSDNRAADPADTASILSECSRTLKIDPPPILGERAAAQRAEERRNEFLAMLSHELRNPLAAILNALQLCDVPNADETTFEWSRIIMRRQLTHLTHLVDELLDVAGIAGGKVQLH